MSTLLGVVLIVLGLVAAAFLAACWLVLKAAVNQEAAAVFPAMTRSILERAKARLPAEAQPRWEEEWPAGFREAIEKRPIWALREAVSLYVGAGRVARAMEPVAASTGAGGRFATASSSAVAGASRVFRWVSQALAGLAKLENSIDEGIERLSLWVQLLLKLGALILIFLLLVLRVLNGEFPFLK